MYCFCLCVLLMEPSFTPWDGAGSYILQNNLVASLQLTILVIFQNGENDMARLNNDFGIVLLFPRGYWPKMFLLLILFFLGIFYRNQRRKRNQKI